MTEHRKLTSTDSEDPDNSVFVAKWTDPDRRERWQYYTREKYEFFKSAREMMFKANIDYGKWLLASGLAVHGGAIYAINLLKDPTRPDLLIALLQAAKWNVAGIVFVLTAGFAAWINFQAAANIYHDWADPRMVHRTDYFPSRDSQKRDVVGATRVFAMGMGFLSLWALVASAANVFSALGPK
ncbi:hypothetical protein [Rhizobium sp. LC145]|uniref:hypothetical protein n=1 Tax=Rhizobium sp. LC145 TaxID=1120688 RepID=UPI00062A0E6D|nr:hypothetical protein [Rhizobium sp. LC145]KKX31956.1 hypothetical protein YH62_11075 [Rhizobium sp. LC145]TKT59011.1 hypothetical protein FDR95_10555 [Rhizobiaceae bacterium LC148]